MAQPHFISHYNTLKSMVDERLATVASANAPASLYEPARYLLEASGKRIRPLIVILCAEATGSKAEDALDAAVAVEMVHNFTLVHDDIMDDASQRRGAATVHTKWNANIAILTGDVVLAQAYNMLLHSVYNNTQDIVRAFTQGVIDVCEGQAYDMEFEERTDVTMEEYLLMIEKKTAKLLEMCAEVGARIGSGTAEHIKTLREYARHAGIAFQIQDDLLDVVAEEEAFGKTIGGDITRGKKTFLLVDALARKDSFEAGDKKVIETLLQNHGTTTGNVTAVKKIYERYSIIDNARSAVDAHVRSAKNCLEQLPESLARTMLGELAENLGTREF